MKLNILLFLTFTSLLNANSTLGMRLSQSLHLSAGSKAILQWERVFKSKRKMKRYNIISLSENEKNALQEYLVNHAIDSDQPTIAGE